MGRVSRQPLQIKITPKFWPPSGLIVSKKLLMANFVNRGTVNLVQVVDGTLKINDKITSLATTENYTVRSLNLLSPVELPIKALYPGQVGVMTCNMRSMDEAIIGDTFHLTGAPVDSLMTVSRPKPMVFAGIYPIDQSNFNRKNFSMTKLLNKLIFYFLHRNENSD